ncbi:MAG: DNA polymerase [Opitutales bacterium]|nr:DNA polymerase [Opitutales bacterium]
MICGLWVDDEGRVHVCEKDGQGRTCSVVEGFRPFIWAEELPMAEGIEVRALEGDGALDKLIFFDSPAVFRAAASDRSLPAEAVKPLEAQYLMHTRSRYYEGMLFAELRRVTLDLEIDCPDEAPDPTQAAHRVLAIGMILPDGKTLVLEPEDVSSDAERKMLKRFVELLLEADPDLVEGHGILSGPLDFLFRRCRRYRVAPQWGRFGQNASIRKSRMRIAERWIDFQRCDMPGRGVFDSAIAVQVYDISARELPGYELDEVAEYFGALPEDADADGAELTPAQELERRLGLARAVSDTLLPTYFAQAQNIPLPMQEVCLRGSSAKVDSLLFERYYHGSHALPDFPESVPFEGAFSHSFETGVFHNVLHYDVASLYPSLLLSIGRGPAGDALNVFVPLLKELRELRLEYKRLAKEAATDELRNTHNARQQSFKILINSFYGYLGFPQARFADPGLAAEITRRGRELLQSLIAEFQELGCRVLEADTDGIYLEGGKYWDEPEDLLAKVSHLLPQGVALEFDGRYDSMFCYKAKNYALYDGGRITMKGSAFRSRGTEPFLKRLTRQLVAYMLGAEEKTPAECVCKARKLIESGSMDVRQLARGEYLSMSPEAYRKKIEAGGKPRRASLEVALRMNPPPRMGERVLYYILPKQKGQTSDWQRARPLHDFDAQAAPYAADYYLKKLDEWLKRYADFVGDTSGQEELF